MKIPKTFEYKGKVWKISLEKNLCHDDGTKCNGLCDTEAREIWLEHKLNKDSKIFTLFHELFHVIVHEAHIPPNALLTDDIEDILSEAFADLLTTSFKGIQFK